VGQSKALSQLKTTTLSSMFVVLFFLFHNSNTLFIFVVVDVDVSWWWWDSYLCSSVA